MQFDVVVRGGTVVDGTGLAGYQADVGVRDGRIAAIGRLDPGAARVVDAEGHVVTPGFIEGHTHMDAQVFWDPLGTCSCWHGVTTAVMGHCGFSLAPAGPDERALVVRNLERAEDISAKALAAGIDWTWTSFSEYLDAVDRAPKGLNYAANVGHSAVRTFVMGDRAFTEPASADDVAAMERELAASLRAGAWGFTTSLSVHHQTSDDRPVASRQSTWDELERLVGVMGSLGAGIFQLIWDLPAPDAADPVASQVIDLALRTKVPFLVPATGNLIPYVLPILDRAAGAGARITGLTHCRGISGLSSFRSQLPFDSLPEWKAVRDLPEPEMIAALRDPDVRARLVAAAHHGEYRTAYGTQARKPEYDRMLVMSAPVPPWPSVAELAAVRGVDPVEVMIDEALETNLERFFFQTISVYDRDDVRRALTHPNTVMAFSDAGAHVSQISDASIQTHFLADWVRNGQEFSIEEAVRMLTLVPARVWGFHDRGLLREGMVADINVFDPATVAPAMPTIQHDLPAGEKRIVQRAVGFRSTIVGGEVVHLDGEHTGALPGRLLRGRLAAAGSAGA